MKKVINPLAREVEAPQKAWLGVAAGTPPAKVRRPVQEPSGADGGVHGSPWQRPQAAARGTGRSPPAVSLVRCRGRAAAGRRRCTCLWGSPKDPPPPPARPPGGSGGAGVGAVAAPQAPPSGSCLIGWPQIADNELMGDGLMGVWPPPPGGPPHTQPATPYDSCSGHNRPARHDRRPRWGARYRRVPHRRVPSVPAHRRVRRVGPRVRPRRRRLGVQLVRLRQVLGAGILPPLRLCLRPVVLLRRRREGGAGRGPPLRGAAAAVPDQAGGTLT
eukprot:gene5055-biopygen13140